MPNYHAWIETATEGKRLNGQCLKFSKMMQAAFPELARVYGWVRRESAPGVRWPHWYCLCPAGGIVDPTAAQFGRILEYGLYPTFEDSPVSYCRTCKRLICYRHECPRDPVCGRGYPRSRQ